MKAKAAPDFPPENELCSVPFPIIGNATRIAEGEFPFYNWDTLLIAANQTVFLGEHKRAFLSSERRALSRRYIWEY